MDAPPGKTLITLADGRTIAVLNEDAAKYDYFSQEGKVLRKPKAPATPAAPPPVARPPPEPASIAPTRAPSSAAAPPQYRNTAPPAPAAPPPRPPPPPPRPIAPPPRAAPFRRAAPRAPARAPARPAVRTMPTKLPWLDYNMRAVIVAALLLALLAFNPIIATYAHLVSEFSPCTVNQRTYPHIATFDVTRDFGISSPGGDITYHLGVASPYDIPGMQDLLTPTTFSPAPTYTPPASDPNGKIYWNRSLAQGSHEAVDVTYHLRMTTVQWPLTDADVGTTANVPTNLRSIYLDEEWKINPNSPTVQRLANEITNSNKSYLQQIKDLYKYLLCPPYTYKAGGNFEPQSPEETVQLGTGDCDDYSVLFISMARYLGIPAWLELGLLYDDVRNDWGPHGWATVYIPLKSGGGVNVTIDVVNKLFLIRDPYHFSDWSSDGDADHLRAYYTLMTYAPATTPPVQLTSLIPPVTFQLEGQVNYFSP